MPSLRAAAPLKLHTGAKMQVSHRARQRYVWRSRVPKQSCCLYDNLIIVLLKSLVEITRKVWALVKILFYKRKNPLKQGLG